MYNVFMKLQDEKTHKNVPMPPHMGPGPVFVYQTNTGASSDDITCSSTKDPCTTTHNILSVLTNKLGV